MFQDIPTRLDKDKLKDYAQLNERFEVSCMFLICYVGFLLSQKYCIMKGFVLTKYFLFDVIGDKSKKKFSTFLQHHSFHECAFLRL